MSIKVNVNKVAAVAVFAEGLVTSAYMSDILREHRKDQKFTTIAAETGLQLLTSMPFYGIALKLWNEKGYEFEIGKKTRDGEKLTKEIYDLCEQVENNKMVASDAYAQVKEKIDRFANLSVGDRSRAVGLLNMCSPLLTAIKADGDLYEAIVLGDALLHIGDPDEVDDVFLTLVAFAETASELFDLIHDKSVRRSIRKNVREALLGIVSQDYDNVQGLHDLYAMLQDLNSRVFEPDDSEEIESNEGEEAETVNPGATVNQVEEQAPAAAEEAPIPERAPIPEEHPVDPETEGDGTPETAE